MRYGSVCSGVEAATLAWRSLGWECVFVSEVEPFPCAVLQERLGASRPIHPLDPDEATTGEDRKTRLAWMKQNEKLDEFGIIPNEGDFTKIGDKYRGKIDLLVGGTPCQDLSVAGKRAGFGNRKDEDDDDAAKTRSSLAIDFVRLAYLSECRWFIWENVPGVFSSNGGGDFATLLSLFAGFEIGVPAQGFGSAGFVLNGRRDRFGLAWRVLDAQYTRVPGSFPFAVPQRRRRVFLVGCLGDWESAAKVLLEPGCMSWITPPRRKTRKAAPSTFGSGFKNASAIRMRSECEGGGKGALVGNELSHTLSTGNDQTIVGFNRFSHCFSINADLNSGNFYYVACYENHANDSRVTFSGDVAPVLSARAGTGGGNLPLVLSGTDLYFDVGNGQVDCSMHPLYECATTLHCMHDANAVMCVPINSMIIGKNVIFGDRQTIGIGEDGDALPTIGANHHHAVAVASFVGRQGAKAGGIGYAEEVTPTVRASQDIHIVVASFMGGQGGQEGSICFSDELAPTIKASPSLVPDIVVSSFAIAETVIGRETKNGGNGIGAREEVAYTLDTAGVQGVAVDVMDKQGTLASDVVPCLTATTHLEAPSIRAFGYVRRLLPIECERLMGFPDNWTRIPWNGKSELECPDSPRYKACGNSMCVNCMRWIGEQIQCVENEKIKVLSCKLLNIV